MGLEELVLLVPQLLVDALAQVGRLVKISFGLIGRVGKSQEVADGHRVAVHVGIDRGTQVFLPTASADGLLHSVAHILLPVEASIARMGGLPLVVLPFQRGQHVEVPLLAASDLIAFP